MNIWSSFPCFSYVPFSVAMQPNLCTIGRFQFSFRTSLASPLYARLWARLRQAWAHPAAHSTIIIRTHTETHTSHTVTLTLRRKYTHARASTHTHTNTCFAGFWDAWQSLHCIWRHCSKAWSIQGLDLRPFSTCHAYVFCRSVGVHDHALICCIPTVTHPPLIYCQSRAMAMWLSPLQIETIGDSYLCATNLEASLLFLSVPVYFGLL